MKCLLVTFLHYLIKLKTVSYLTTLAYNINFDIDKCTKEVISH